MSIFILNYSDHNYVFLNNSFTIKLSNDHTIISLHELCHKRYLDICIAGAYSRGEAFGKKFEESTFLMDGKSLADYSNG